MNESNCRKWLWLTAANAGHRWTYLNGQRDEIKIRRPDPLGGNFSRACMNATCERLHWYWRSLFSVRLFVPDAELRFTFSSKYSRICEGRLQKEDNSCSIEISWGAEVSVNLLLNRIYVVFRSAGDPLYFSWPPANLRLLYYFSLLQNSCRIPISRQVSVACYTWETSLWFSWIPFQNFEVKFCL